MCRAAEDIDPILHSFKNDQQLCVGVRDILGKEDIQATTGALSDIAEACLAQIAVREYERLVARFGQPTVSEGRRAGQPCEMVVLALGKFGGREMNYHSDLDVIFLYEADGQTRAGDGPARQSTTNQHFFSELGQRIIKTTSRLSGLRPALRSRRPAASHGQERHAGHHLRRVRPLFHRRRRAALGAAGAVQGPRGLRLAAGRKNGHGGRGQGRLRPPLAAQRRRGHPPHAAAAWKIRRPRRAT